MTFIPPAIFLLEYEKQVNRMEILLVLWGSLLVGIMAVGGFFMFRKFLKSLPKEDGKSKLDWELYYIDKTKEMWNEEEREFLEELISPVPELFRDVARQSIASKIGEIALKKGEKIISRESLIEGYILASPKRDHKFLRKKLKEHHIDPLQYEHLFELSRKDYKENWQAKYKKLQKEASN